MNNKLNGVSKMTQKVDQVTTYFRVLTPVLLSCIIGLLVWIWTDAKQSMNDFVVEVKSYMEESLQDRRQLDKRLGIVESEVFKKHTHKYNDGQ